MSEKEKRGQLRATYNRDTAAVVVDADRVVLFVDVDANERHVRIALLVVGGVD